MHRRRTLPLFAVLAALSVSSAALAQAPGQTPQPGSQLPYPGAAPTGPVYGPSAEQDTVEIKRYGHHILMADGAFLALTVATKQPTLVLSYLLTGPGVHIAHGNPGRALGSLALRVGAPLTGAVVGMAMENCGGGGDDEFCGLAGFVLGGLAGMVGAVIIDAAVIARERVEKAPPRFIPIASVTKSGTMQLGLAGHF